MSQNKKTKKSDFLLPLAFFVFLTGFGLFVLSTQPATTETESLEKAIEKKCVLEYGESECINEMLSIPFYNSGQKSISRAEITIPTINGLDIARIDEELAPKQSGAIQLTSCTKIKNTEGLKLKWCCEKCYETEMTNPTKTVNLKTIN